MNINREVCQKSKCEYHSFRDGKHDCGIADWTMDMWMPTDDNKPAKSEFTRHDRVPSACLFIAEQTVSQQ